MIAPMCGRLLDRLAASAPVHINIANRLVGVVGRIGLLAVVLVTLSPAMQGFYYTFYSLVFLRFFAELGLTVAVVQLVAHAGSVPGRERQLRSYTRFFSRWFMATGALLTLCLLPAIALFHEEYAALPDPFRRIVAPWASLAIGTGCAIFVTGLLAVLEGHRRILAVSKIRLGIGVANIAVTALALLAGAELWSLALGALAGAAVGFGGLWRQRELFLFPRGETFEPVDWRGSIWPFQWRIAVSWISGFFIFYFLTPLVMRVEGPVAAGQFGMSLQIVQSVSSIGALHVSTYTAVFGSLVARKRFAEMDALFISSSKRSTVLLIALLAAFWTAKAALDALAPGLLRDRLLVNPSLLFLFLACFSNHAFFLIGYYMRSFRQEAFWGISLANAIATVGLAVILVPRHGIAAAVAVYTVNSVIFWIVIGVPFALRRRQRALRHERAATEEISGGEP